MVTCGIHWSTAFSSALILACTPVFTLLTLHHAGLEPLTRRQVAGLVAQTYTPEPANWPLFAAHRRPPCNP